MNHRIVTIEEVKERVFRPGVVNYIGMMMRPGIYCWTVEIEYTMFKPDTDANDEFHLGTIAWPKDWPPPWNIYCIASFHERAQEFAESILWKHGLRKVAPGHTIVSFGGERSPEQEFPVDIEELIEKGSLEFTIGKLASEKFPLEGPNIFFLENHSKGASNVVYTNDPEKLRAAWELELKQAQVFFDEHQRWLQTPEGKAIFEAYWAKHPEGHVE